MKGKKEVNPPKKNKNKNKTETLSKRERKIFGTKLNAGTGPYFYQFMGKLSLQKIVFFVWNISYEITDFGVPIAFTH